MTGMGAPATVIAHDGQQGAFGGDANVMLLADAPAGERGLPQGFVGEHGSLGGFRLHLQLGQHGLRQVLTGHVLERSCHRG